MLLLDSCSVVVDSTVANMTNLANAGQGSDNRFPHSLHNLKTKCLLKKSQLWYPHAVTKWVSIQTRNRTIQVLLQQVSHIISITFKSINSSWSSMTAALRCLVIACLLANLTCHAGKTDCPLTITDNACVCEASTGIGYDVLCPNR